MTLNQIAERVAYALNEPLNQMLKENIKFSVRYWRAMLIRRDIQANGMSDEFLQRVYIPLIKVDKADACNFNLGDCKILRSENKIPKPIRVKNDVLFKFVGTVDGKSFTYTEYEEVPYTCYNRFTSKVIRYVYINEYIYIFNNDLLKQFAIQTPFVDPYKANTVCGTTCFDDNSDFPCPDDMVQQIVSGILQGEFKLMNPIDKEVEVDEDKTIK